jgi:hypothetical protein
MKARTNAARCAGSSSRGSAILILSMTRAFLREARSARSIQLRASNGFAGMCPAMMTGFASGLAI